MNETLSPFMYGIAYLDYLFVLILYLSTSFCLAVYINLHVLTPVFEEDIQKESTPYLALQILMQFSLQGFIAVFLSIILQKIPSPFNGIHGYDSNSSLGSSIRNPAIISLMLFILSKSLQAKLNNLFYRFG